MKRLSIIFVFIMMVVFIISTIPTQAQTSAPAWKPSGPISMICGHGAGGGFDNWARAISMVMQRHVDVPVVVKNIPGLGGATAVETLWRSKPDGQTIHLFEGGSLLSAQYLLGHSYDIHKLTFIGTVQNAPFAMFVAKTSALNSMQDFVKAGKSKTLRGGTTGLSSGLWQSMAVFANEAGFNVRAVPGYQSGADMLVGLEAGDFDTMFIPPQTALASMKRGSVKALAVSGTSRDQRIPDTPTFAEAGFPKTGTFGTVIRAVAAPPDTPSKIANFLEKAFLDTMRDSKFLDWVKSQNDFIEPLNSKQTVELFQETDKVIKEFLPILKQYVK
jgi:tripartite-type tricarboxylate transporter receptor subunit TctC